MPYRICKTIEVESGHMLSKHPGNCKFPHGHSRQVEIVLEADDLDSNEMVCDFKVVKAAIKPFLDTFDHAICVNTNDPMYEQFKKAYGDRVISFEGKDPTTEVVAKIIFDKVKTCLADYSSQNSTGGQIRNQVRLTRIRVWETSSAWGEYFETD